VSVAVQSSPGDVVPASRLRSIRYLPGVGLVQRLLVLATSAWLAVLALAQRRIPSD
jgi:hypothetical protein